MAGLHNSSAFHFEIGSEEPKEEQTVKYKNYRKYAITYGENRFIKDCNE